MIDAWRDLSERERALILVAAGLAALFVLSQFVLMPINAWRTDQSRNRASAENLYEIVAEAAAVAGDAPADAPKKANIPVRNAVTESARAGGVNINFVSARDDGSIETSTPSASPERLFVWLESLRADYGVSVAYADIAREEGGVNTVRARLVLERNEGAK